MTLYPRYFAALLSSCEVPLHGDLAGLLALEGMSSSMFERVRPALKREWDSRLQVAGRAPQGSCNDFQYSIYNYINLYSRH